MSAVRFDAVSKTFGEVEALQRTDLDVVHGEFLTLLGPSGPARQRCSISAPDTSIRRRAASSSMAVTSLD